MMREGSRATASPSAPCCMPGCANLIPWRVSGRGDQPEFCSQAHRFAARDEIRTLRRRLAEVEAQLSTTAHWTIRQQHLLVRRQVLWQLYRHPAAVVDVLEFRHKGPPAPSA